MLLDHPSVYVGALSQKHYNQGKRNPFLAYNLIQSNKPEIHLCVNFVAVEKKFIPILWNDYFQMCFASPALKESDVLYNSSLSYYLNSSAH